jgi:hypothetical protein
VNIEETGDTEVKRGCENHADETKSTLGKNENSLPGIYMLNTGYGDFELRFNPNSPEEVQKAKETITDMLKRGYAIFVRKGTETFRVRKFDADNSEP